MQRPAKFEAGGDCKTAGQRSVWVVGEDEIDGAGGPVVPGLEQANDVGVGSQGQEQGGLSGQAGAALAEVGATGKLGNDVAAVPPGIQREVDLAVAAWVGAGEPLAAEHRPAPVEPDGDLGEPSPLVAIDGAAAQRTVLGWRVLDHGPMAAGGDHAGPGGVLGVGCVDEAAGAAAWDPARCGWDQ